MKETLKKIWPDALVVVALLLVSLCYFIGPVSQGLTLGGHDYQAATGLGREQADYLAQSGEQTRWTNAVFSGMPTYQTAPSYKATHVLGFFSDVYALGTSGVVSYVFLYLLGFYILMRAFGFRPLLSVLGAVAWAFSSYFFIIITAGHIWKVLTLAFIPPTIAGLVLCYRGRLLWGGAVTALFTAFQVLSNHVQMTYYFLFVMLFIVVAYGIDAVRRGTWRAWLKATGTVVAAGLLGVLANLPNLYHTYEYSKESTRGRAELSPLPGAAQQAPTDGLDRDYITQWSYGLDETLTLLVPNYKGGGSASVFDMPGADEKPEMAQLYQYAGQAQQSLDELGSQNPLPGLSQYWGDQPMTVGPVYVGAFIVFLFILGLFYVRGPMKWALAASTVLSLLFAWGRNLMPVTDFFIDWLPMYSKFRTVSSALVIAEFTIPLLAVLCLARLLREPDLVSRRPAPFIGTLAVTGGFCLLLWLFPGMAGNCLSAGEADAMSELSRVLPPDFIAGYTDTIATIRHGVLRADALRSLLIILVGAGLLWLYLRRKLGGTVVTVGLAVLCLFDLWQVDKRYLNDGLFSLPTGQARTIDPTPADEQILADKDPDFRVLNLSEGKPFNESSNRTSYFHKSIGGYHPAKLRRYQDLIDRHLMPEVMGVAQALSATLGDVSRVNLDTVCPTLNMLNTKYFIVGQGEQNFALANPRANGNGWFVGRLDFVRGADAEMAALDRLDTKRAAVADEAFRPQLGGAQLGTGTVRLTSYKPNELRYDVTSDKGGVVVFSEVYYPGWTATIDGQPAELGRANYVLRALKVPAGSHKVVMEFRPASVTATETVAIAAIALVVLTFLYALLRRSGLLQRKRAMPKGTDDVATAKEQA